MLVSRKVSSLFVLFPFPFAAVGVPKSTLNISMKHLKELFASSSGIIKSSLFPQKNPHQYQNFIHTTAVYTHKYIYIYRYKSKNIYLKISMYIYIYLYTYVFISISLYINIYIYIL